jgi:hypothetical protein
MEILPPGARARQALDRIRAERENVEIELDQVVAATLGVDETVARFMAAHNEPLARAESYALAFSRPGSTPEPLNVTALLSFNAWLDAKDFETKLRRRYKELLPAPGLPAGARPAAIAKLKARFADLDEAEEVEVCKLEAEGFAVDRRSDVELSSLLDVWDRTAA